MTFASDWHYFLTFAEKVNMSDLQTYAEAVRVIKEAILRSQYRAASSTNKEQLSLYYGIGCYISKNSREGFWGKGAIESISRKLQKELPGLRGFSATNIKNMRSFYEEWSPFVSRPPMADENKSLTAVSDSELNEQILLMEIRQPMADEFNWADFVAIGFSHHIEIITKAKSLEARLFFISMNQPHDFGISTLCEIISKPICTTTEERSPIILLLQYRVLSRH